MTTNMPTALDSFTDPTSSSNMSVLLHHLQHTDANDAIEAIEQLLVGPAFGYNVVGFGADPTGTNDSTAAFVDAQDAGGSGAYALWTPPGTYKIAGPLNTFASQQGILGPGSQLVTLNYTGSGTCIVAEGTSGSSQPGGAFRGFSIAGTSSATAGLQWSNLSTARCYDLSISGFTGSSAMGLYLFNTASGSSCEKGSWKAISLSNNTTCAVFDSHSFDYGAYEFFVICSANQNGVTLQNSAQLVGVDFTMLGDFHAGSTNTGWALGFDPAGGGVGTSTAYGRFNVFCECDAGSGSTGHIPIKFDGADGVAGLMGSGCLFFINEGESWSTVSGFASNGLVGFNGYSSVPGLNSTGDLGDGGSVIGGMQYGSVGSLTSGSHLTTLSVQRGDIVVGQLASGSNSISLSNFPSGSGARRLTLIIVQPASGSAGTLSYPANWYWPSGTTPTLSTANSARDVIEVRYDPVSTDWYCSLVGTGFAA